MNQLTRENNHTENFSVIKVKYYEKIATLSDPNYKQI